MIAPTTADFERVLDAHPWLTNFGFGTYDPWRLSPAERAEEFARDRARLRKSFSGVVEVAGWLRANIRATKTVTGRSPGSYWLKHVAEAALGRYVTNGELIAAAAMAGYPILTGYPNAGVGVSRLDVDAVVAVSGCAA